MPPSCHRSIALPQALGLCRTVQGHKSGPGQMPRREMLGSWRCWKLLVYMSFWCLEMCWVLSYWSYWRWWHLNLVILWGKQTRKRKKCYQSTDHRCQSSWKSMKFYLIFCFGTQPNSLFKEFLSPGFGWAPHEQAVSMVKHGPRRPRACETRPEFLRKLAQEPKNCDQVKHLSNFDMPTSSLVQKARVFSMCPSQIRDYPGLANPKVPKIFPKSSQNQKKTMPSKAPGWKGADVRERSNILVLAFNWPILFKTWNQLKIYGKPLIFPWNVGMSCKCSIDGKMLALVWTSISPINLQNDRLSRVFNLFNHRFFLGLQYLQDMFQSERPDFSGWFQDFRELASKRPWEYVSHM